MWCLLIIQASKQIANISKITPAHLNINETEENIRLSVRD